MPATFTVRRRSVGDAYQQLGWLFREALAKEGVLDRKAVANVTADNRADFYFFAGRFLELRGKKEQAVPYFRACLRCKPRDRFACLAACQRLRALGLDTQEK